MYICNNIHNIIYYNHYTKILINNYMIMYSYQTYVT